MSREKKALYSTVVTLISLFVLLGFSASVQAAGAKLLSDPGFESYEGATYASWTEVGTESKILKGTTAHGGTDSCRFLDPTLEYGDRGMRSAAVSVTAGKTYDFGAWFYVHQEELVTSTINNTLLRCRIQWRDSLDAVISSSPGTTGWSLSAFNTWEDKKKGDNIAAPTGAVTATLLIEGKETYNGNNDIYIDDTYIYSDNAPNGPWPVYPRFMEGAVTNWFNDNTILFEWSHSDFDGDGQQKYQVQVAADSGFGSVNYDSGAVTSSNEYWPSGAIADGGYYYWRVKTWDTDERVGAWQTTTAADGNFKVDATSPSNWANFASQKSDETWIGTGEEDWNDTQTPNCRVRVTDATSGLKKANHSYGIDANVVGLWPLSPEEGNEPGYMYDKSGHQNHGTGYNLDWGEDNGFDSPGMCQGFNDSTSKITIPEDDGDFDLTTAITVEAWVNTDQLPGNGEWDMIVSKWDAHMLRVNTFDETTSNEFEFFVWDTAWRRCASGIVPTPGQWYYVVGTYDGTNMRIYVNGVLKNTVAAGTIATNNNNVLIGDGWDGWIDEVRISNVVRSTADIALYYNNAAQYSYSTNGGGAWSAWASATLAGSDGDTGATYITASSVPFNQNHATDNQIKFRVMDIAGNIGTSGAYTVKIDNVVPNNPAIECYEENSHTTPIAEDTWQTDGVVSWLWDWTDRDPSSGTYGYYEYNTDPGNTISGEESTYIVNDDFGLDSPITDYALTEGMRYFHVKSMSGAGLWGEEDVFTIKYDEADPEITGIAIASTKPSYFYEKDTDMADNDDCIYFNSLSGEGGGQTITIAVTWDETNKDKVSGETAFGETPEDPSEADGWELDYTIENDSTTFPNLTVTATDLAGRTDTYDVDFTQDNAAPTNVGCSTPADNAQDQLTDIILTCLDATDAGAGLPLGPYYFQLDTVITFGSEDFQESEWQDSLEWSPSTLSVNTTYYWRVKAKDNVGNESDQCGHTANEEGYGTFTTAAVVHPVISEIQTNGGGASPATDEFIELYNPTNTDIDISNWSIQEITAATGAADYQKKDIGSATVPAKSYFLIAHTNYDESTILADLSYNAFDLDAGGATVFLVNDQVQIADPNTDPNIVDKVAYGTTSNGGSLYPETAEFSSAPSANKSIERRSGCPLGSRIDTDDNSSDFKSQTTISNPQKTTCPVVSSVSPDEGGAGTEITIIGENFTNDPSVSAVELWTTPTDPHYSCEEESYSTSTQMTATIPSGLSASTIYYVVVENPDGQKNSPGTTFEGTGAAETTITITNWRELY